MRGFRTDLLFRDGLVGVAVSGGADSVALLHLLAERGFAAAVLHVNHGLRGAESDADQEFVSQTATKLGCRFLVHHPGPAAGNVEQAARRARYGWFRELIQAGTVTQVVTAHTADDQAETVLFRFLRGSGSAGLAAIRPDIEGVVRPLLDIRRADLRGYLASRGLTWREDSSNQSLQYRRNRIRHELLPSLEADWNPNLTAALAQTALWAQGEEDYWRAAIKELTQNWVRFAKNSAVLEATRLQALPIAAARRVLRLAVEHAQGDLRQVDFAHIERVRALACRAEGSGSFRTARWEAKRSGAQLRIAALSFQREPFLIPIVVPGCYPLPHESVTLRLELKPVDNVYNDSGQQVDWSLVCGSLELRNWQPGDLFRHARHRTPRKLKHFFQETGIPSWERSGWPVLTCANSIIWSRGLGVSADFLPSTGTVTALQIQEVPEESQNQNVSI